MGSIADAFAIYLLAQLTVASRATIVLAGVAVNSIFGACMDAPGEGCGGRPARVRTAAGDEGESELDGRSAGRDRSGGGPSPADDGPRHRARRGFDVRIRMQDLGALPEVQARFVEKARKII